MTHGASLAGRAPGSDPDAAEVAVLGAGAVGGTLAALLEGAGARVTIVARGEGLRAIRERGLVLERAGERSVHRVRAVPALDDSAGLVLCATKAFDAAAALRANAATLNGAIVVMLQNGLRGPRIARETLGSRARIVGGLALFAANLRAPGHVELTAPGSVQLGLGPGAPPADAITAARLLAPALPARAIGDFPGAQWGKLLVNHVNAIPAITGTSVQRTAEVRGLRLLLARSMRETMRLARAMRIRPRPIGPLGPRELLRLETASPAEAARTAGQLCASFGPVPNEASTLQSIRRGARSENDELSGAVVRLARARRVQVPACELLHHLVERVERTGRFLREEQLLAAARDLPETGEARR